MGGGIVFVRGGYQKRRMKDSSEGRAKRQRDVVRRRRRVAEVERGEKDGKVIGSQGVGVRGVLVLLGEEIWRAEKRWMACQRWPDILEMGCGKELLQLRTTEEGWMHVFVRSLWRKYEI